MMLINGEWIESEDQKEVLNPYTNEVIGKISQASEQMVKDAVKSAKNFSPKLTLSERSSILVKTAAMVTSKMDTYINLIVSEAGVSHKAAKKEVTRACGLMKVAAEETKRLTGESISLDRANGKAPLQTAITRRVPIGLVCAITPFNRPLNQVVVKLAPAIATNNTIVLKPSEKTPLTALQYVKDLVECGLPSKMITVLTGDPSVVGNTLINCPEVDMVTFTGSQAVGEHIAKSVGMIKTAFELGDSGVLVVLKDGDIDAAVKASVAGAFSTSGQSCRGVKRILVEDSIADEFSSKLVEASKKLVVGDPMNTDTDLGTLIDERSAIAVLDIVAKAVNDGAKVLLSSDRKGAQLGPIVIDQVSRDSDLVKLETFGPCAPIIRIKNIEDAVECTNNTEYGLQSGLFTNDFKAIQYFIDNVDSGAVIINDGPQFANAGIPFGGVKKSGLGREGVKWSMEEMTTIKTIVM